MLIYLVFGIILFWLIGLSYIVYSTRQHYFNLISRTKRQRIDEILTKLIENDQKCHLDTEKTKKEIEKIIDNSKLYLQKLGLIRFNPFGRTGGEQSFVLALLDANNNGIIINFIYTHEGIRIYTKRIKNGKGEQYDLSDEEREAIEKATSY